MARSTHRLNQKFVASLGEPEKDVFYWDAELKGFFVRVRPGAAPAWGVRYKHEGKARTVVIGPCHEVKAEKARGRAIEIKQSARLGVDLVATSKAVIASPTVEDLAREHQLLHIPPRINEDTFADRKGHWENHIVPALGPIRVAELSRSDVEKFYLKFAGQPSLGNRLLATLSKAINDSMTFRPPWRKDNPVALIERLPENKRDRILSREEMARFMEVVRDMIDRREEISWWSAPYLFTALLISGLRLSELSKRKWSEVDLVAGTLFIPKTKSRKPRTVTLSAPMINLLSIMPRKCEWVFPKSMLTGPFAYPQNQWKIVRERARIHDVRIHDLRHTFASYAMHAGGLSQREIMELLGHHQMSTTERYLNVHDEMKKSISDRAAGSIIGLQV